MSSQNRNGKKPRKRYLFSYGTLLPGHAPKEIAPTVRQLRRVGRGFVRGRLYDLGDYPGAVLTRNGPLIRGLVFELPDDPTVLKRIDQYEEFDRTRPSGSLFVRRQRLVSLQNGKKVACWIYIYNGSTDTARPLPSGQYSKTKNRASQ